MILQSVILSRLRRNASSWTKVWRLIHILSVILLKSYP